MGQIAPYKIMLRLMRKVKPDPETGCWFWTGAKTSSGYGTIGFNSEKHYTHRLMHKIHNGFLSDDEPFVCHTCDNPSCINPDHLWSGDHRDNMKDAAEKGRMSGGAVTGESHGEAKLTEADVIELRERYATEAVSQATLGEDYGITQGQVGGIVRGEKWKTAGGPRTNTGAGRNGSNTGNKGGNRRLDAEAVKEIRTEYANTDKSQYDLADEYGVTRPAIGKIVRGDSWPDVGGPTT